MDRARSGLTTLAVVVVLALCWWPASPAPIASAVAAAVAWPPATLVMSEIQTGGASASDEFVEIANQGAGAVDLAGLEVVYVTSSGIDRDSARRPGWHPPGSSPADGCCWRMPQGRMRRGPT